MKKYHKQKIRTKLRSQYRLETWHKKPVRIIKATTNINIYDDFNHVDGPRLNRILKVYPKTRQTYYTKNIQENEQYLPCILGKPSRQSFPYTTENQCSLNKSLNKKSSCVRFSRIPPVPFLSQTATATNTYNCSLTPGLVSPVEGPSNPRVRHLGTSCGVGSVVAG